MREEEEREEYEKFDSDLYQNSDIVALTSFTDKTTYDICLNIGIKEVINKPIHQ